MEIQFEQNRNFNQYHRDVDHENEVKQPLGKEGDPKQRLVKRKELDNDEKELDRRPADVEHNRANDQGKETSSAISGIQSDQQNSTRNSSKPLGED